MRFSHRGKLIVEVVCLCGALLLCHLLRQKVGRDWVFSGSDSYAYVGAASELQRHHRYAFRLPAWHPAEAIAPPLGYCRLPGYALFVAAVAELPARGETTDYDTIFAKVKLAQRGLELLTCLAVYLMARRLCGLRAAWLALLLVGAYPPLWFFSASILTETLATTLTTVALLLLCLAMHGARPAWIAAGAVVALGTLVRVDGILLLFALPLPLLVHRDARGLRTFLGSLLVFALCFAPWPIRNSLRFGAPHPLGGQCDTSGAAMPHTSFYRWFATWVVDESQTKETLYCLLRPNCPSWVETYPPEAFASAEERAEVEHLFMLRRSEGLSQRVDQGFKDLALYRLRAQPLSVLVTLPLRRAYHLWISPQDQPLAATKTPPWPELVEPLRPWLAPLNAMLVCLGLGGLALLLLDHQRRSFGWLALLVLFGRTALLSLIGFVDNRYVLEVTPLVIVLCSVLLCQGLGTLPALQASRRETRTRTPPRFPFSDRR